MTTAELRLEGAPNFRDLGGYTTTDGRTVKHGLIYRSGESSGLTDADIDKLKRLGPKLVVDLRSNKEAAAAKILWPMATDTEFIAANILADIQAGNHSLSEIVRQDQTAQGAARAMETTYSVLPHALGPTVLQMAKYIVEADKLPVILHCAIGRDRAGITAALLLFALGVPRDTVIADYMRTNVCINAPHIREIARVYMVANKIELNEEALDILTFARIEHYHAAFRTISVEYGTVQDYLRAIGIDAALQTALQERLLEPRK